MIFKIPQRNLPFTQIDNDLIDNSTVRAGTERRKKQRRTAKSAALNPASPADPQPQHTTARQF